VSDTLTNIDAGLCWCSASDSATGLFAFWSKATPDGALPDEVRYPIEEADLVPRAAWERAFEALWRTTYRFELRGLRPRLLERVTTIRGSAFVGPPPPFGSVHPSSQALAALAGSRAQGWRPVRVTRTTNSTGSFLRVAVSPVFGE
jgi:hypothetical protein